MKSLDDIKKHISKSDVSGKRHAGYEVPDQYFEALSENILAKAIAEEVKPIRKINWYKFSAVAASISVLLVCIFLLQTNDPAGTEVSLASTEITVEESYDFILNEDLDDISTEDILEIENIDEILDELAQEFAN